MPWVGQLAKVARRSAGEAPIPDPTAGGRFGLTPSARSRGFQETAAPRS